MNQDLIEAFQAQHPHITVIPEFGDIGGYWDKLSTQTAGNDTPDVLFMNEQNLPLYAGRGVLGDLSEYGLDTSQINQSVIDSGTIDGALYGIPGGLNARGFLADPQVFDEAGIEMPDDATWTWEDYVEIATQVSRNTPDGVYGTQEYGFGVDMDMAVWARQHGQNLWENGQVGFQPELMAERWQISLDLIEAGAAPPASESLENQSGSLEQLPLATGRAALGPGWSSELQVLSNASGRELQLLRTPGESQSERPGAYPRPGLLYTMSAASQYPEAAVTFIDWMVNSEEAGAVVKTEYGVPPSQQVQKLILPELNDVQVQAMEYVNQVAADAVDVPAPPPSAAGEMWTELSRLNEEVMFQQASPLEAAERFVSHAESLLE